MPDAKLPTGLSRLCRSARKRSDFSVRSAGLRYLLHSRVFSSHLLYAPLPSSEYQTVAIIEELAVRHSQTYDAIDDLRFVRLNFNSFTPLDFIYIYKYRYIIRLPFPNPQLFFVDESPFYSRAYISLSHREERIKRREKFSDKPIVHRRKKKKKLQSLFLFKTFLMNSSSLLRGDSGEKKLRTRIGVASGLMRNYSDAI